MKKKMTALFILTALLTIQNQAQAAPDSSQPLYQAPAVQTAAKAINYRNLIGTAEIYLKGTSLSPDANGIAAIRNKAGVTEIKADFAKLPAATQFGAEYLTYILWAISPDGMSTNLGELIVKNGASQLNAKIPLQAFVLLVTAEPYFAVSQPSNVVILENAIESDNTAKIELIDARYELLTRGKYTVNIAAADLQPQVMDKKTPFAVYQARNAVRIAKAAGAETYAADSFKNAERLLALSEVNESSKKSRAMTARQAVQNAEDSRLIAVKHKSDEALNNERRESQDLLSSANSQAASAIAGQTKAEDAQVKAEQSKGQSDNERAQALALASTAVASSASSQADAKTARASAVRSKGLADVANIRANKAESEKAVLRAQLLTQLNSILRTRDTARGLIVNMPDALFKTGSSELQPQVREKLAKVAGILSSYPDLKLAVEGHTDNVGSDEYNQGLSEKRAQSAREYLVSQGMPAKSIEARGFGKDDPIESNGTPQGRQRNRRVELIVSGAPIGTSAMAK